MKLAVFAGLLGLICPESLQKVPCSALERQDGGVLPDPHLSSLPHEGGHDELSTCRPRRHLFEEGLRMQ